MSLFSSTAAVGAAKLVATFSNARTSTVRRFVARAVCGREASVEEGAVAVACCERLVPEMSESATPALLESMGVGRPRRVLLSSGAVAAVGAVELVVTGGLLELGGVGRGSTNASRISIFRRRQEISLLTPSGMPRACESHPIPACSLALFTRSECGSSLKASLVRLPEADSAGRISLVFETCAIAAGPSKSSTVPGGSW